MVGMDASMVLCYRDEYAKTLGGKRGGFEVLLAHEWLLSFINKETKLNLSANLNKNDTQQVFKLFSHCTEKTALVNSERMNG